MAIKSSLSEAFGNEDTDSYIGKRLNKFVSTAQRTEYPPFPKQIQIETTNICNHSCSFCAYNSMERIKSYMPIDKFEKLVGECYSFGAREIGLFAGAEPFTHPKFLDLIKICKGIGFEYLYISTNGSLATFEKITAAINAGLSSIKFSINGYDKESYKRIHGFDSFDKVIDLVIKLGKWRKENEKKFFLGVSSVGYTNDDYFQPLRDIISDYVDETIYYQANNQSGQKKGLASQPFKECSLPFNKLHISVEGHLKLCCNDYENLLICDEDEKVSLSMLDRWHGSVIRMARRAHMQGDLKGSLCDNCLNNSDSEPKSLLTLYH